MVRRLEALAYAVLLLVSLLACKIGDLSIGEDEPPKKRSRAQPEEPAEVQPTPSPPPAIVRRQEVVIDEEVAIPQGSAQSRTFTLRAPRSVRVSAEGRKHSDKGFSLYVIPENQWEAFKLGGQFQQLDAFHGLKVRQISRTSAVPAGRWTVVVHNSENMMRTAIVRVRVVIDPDPD